MNKFYQKGMTVVETLIVISIMVVLILIVLPQFSKIKENQVIKNAVEDTVSVLHSAQSKSLASVNSGEFGVHFQSNHVIIFKGEVFSAGSIDNNIINIISPARITNVTLGGVSSNSGELYFLHLSGVLSMTGTVTISTSSFL